MRLSGIHVYPVKSLAGQALTSAEVEPWGLRHDRRWLVLEPDGTVLTAREEHRLLGLTARPMRDGIQLATRSGETLVVATPLEGPLAPVAISRLDSVRLADAQAHAWLSDQLQRTVRLGWLDDPHRRSVSASHGGRDGDWLSLADAGPLLLTTTESLRQLNDWMVADALARGSDADLPPAGLEMARFRPSLVVTGVPQPFAEDGWQRVRIGDVQLRLGERCDRCVMATLDPTTLTGGKEPLRTLARHRQWDHSTWFGVRLIPVTTGVLRLDDPVEVSTGESR